MGRLQNFRECFFPVSGLAAVTLSVHAGALQASAEWMGVNGLHNLWVSLWLERLCS